MNRATHQHECLAGILDLPRAEANSPVHSLEQNPAITEDHSTTDSAPILRTSQETIQLHNARNVATHVRAVLDEIIGQQSALSLQPIKQVAALLSHPDQEHGPCQSIGSHLESLAEGLEYDQRRINLTLSTLESSIRDLTEVISQKPDNRSVSDEVESIYLDELITQVVDQCKIRLDKRQINISAVGHLHSAVMTDRYLLRQVINNLIANAEEAFGESSEKQKNISIEWGTLNGWTTISVQDNGRGIEKSSRTQILNLGYSTKEDGQGIGLTFCKDTMERLHGYLDINSDGHNCGTTVTLHLPSER